MTTPKEIQAALDKVENTFRLIAAQDQGCGGNLNPCEIYKAMQKIAIDAIAGMSEIRHVLQSHAQEAKKKDDPLSMGFISVDHDGTKRLDVAGYLSTPEGQKRLAEIMGKQEVTTPQDINAVLEWTTEKLNIARRCIEQGIPQTPQGLAEIKILESIVGVLQSHAPTQNVALDALNRFRGLCRCQPDKPQPCGHCVDMDTIRGFIQSHAPEASPVDADSVLADFYRTSDLKGVTIGEDTVLRVFYRYLLRRGFRQGGGV